MEDFFKDILGEIIQQVKPLPPFVQKAIGYASLSKARKPTEEERYTADEEPSFQESEQEIINRNRQELSNVLKAQSLLAERERNRLLNQQRVGRISATSRSNIKSAQEKALAEQNLQRKALQSQQQLLQQQRSAEDLARLRTVQQRAISDVRKQFATSDRMTRTAPPPVSTASLTRRGRGYDNEVLAILQSYYGLNLKEAKKLYKTHF